METLQFAVPLSDKTAVCDFVTVRTTAEAFHTPKSMSESSSESRSFSRLRQIDRKWKVPVRPKSPIQYPTIKDIIFHRRNLPRTQYYLTSGHEDLGEPRNVNEEQSSFNLPPKSHIFAYYQCWKTWRRQMLSKRHGGPKAAQRHLHSQARDILRRLRVDVEAEAEEATMHKDLDKATAMTDIDPRYFTELKRRITVGGRFSRQRYIEDARQVLKTRLLIGEERDSCIRIDQQFAEEYRRHENIKGKYRSYVNGFEEFLSRDHEESMAVLGSAENEAKSTYAEITKREQLSKELCQARLEVYALEEMWRTVKMCQKFLYQISPTSWRLERDWIHRSPSGASIASVRLDDLLGRYRTPDSLDSLETLIEMFERDVAEARAPEIYFKDPHELVRVFRSMEFQNLNALIHLESLAGPMADMTSNITKTEALIQREMSEIEEALSDLESSIRSEEKRAENLERYANNLLHGVFRELVCSEPVLYLRVFIEDTYESCVAPNYANLDTYSMMRTIEKTYEELNMKLDYLPHEIVKVCEKEGFRQEMKDMKRAEDAARKFELMHRLLAALERIMEAPKPRERQPVSRIAAIESKAKPKSSQPAKPNDEHALFLQFFTNYCKLDNPESFEAQFPDDFDLTFKIKQTTAGEFDGGARKSKADKEKDDFCLEATDLKES